jgi:aspartate/methionine/tyrosine aminotransferase
MSEFQPFVMERMMSLFEQEVEFNLSESGVHPMLLSELLAEREDGVEEILATDLNYPHVNGIPELREKIAALYPGAGPENVLVTVGAIEANFLSVTTVASPGDRAAVMMPNYMQIWGVAKNRGLDVSTFDLLEGDGWALDVDGLEAAVGADTRLIAVCNPNNPTGRVLTSGEMGAVARCAERSGAWILADEVYAGAERLGGDTTPTFWGRHDKVLAVGSLSKAYGMPGLRLGWVVAPEETVAEIWARHEYVTLAATMLSNKLAAIALSPEVRPKVLERTRGYIRRGFPVLESWMAEHPGLFSVHSPDAAAIAFIRYNLDINSTELVDRLRREKSVLVVPGDHFGHDGYLRISFGLPHEYLTAALDRIHDFMTGLTD